MLKRLAPASMPRGAMNWRKVRHQVHWALLHTALLIFFADLIAAFWPSFYLIWETKAHIAIALASFLAVCAEYIFEAEEAREKGTKTDA